MALPSLKISLKVTSWKEATTGELLNKYTPFYNLKDEDGIYGLSSLRLTTEEAGINPDLPVEMTTEIAYDQSINLIVNDRENPPKLVNSRFYLVDSTHYALAERKGNVDTNIYSKENFIREASLIKNINSVVKLDFLGISDGGSMKVGNYHFYFKLADADGNESDFVSESGLVVCHIGGINDPKSIRGGQLDEDSNKLIKFRINNLDLAYDYINIYYTRSSGDGNGSFIKAYKIADKFKIESLNTEISISGYENHVEIDVSEVNSIYTVFDSVESIAQCQNITFAANIKNDYNLFSTLEKYSLLITPEIVVDEDIGILNSKYEQTNNSGNNDDNTNEYYNVKNIYDRLGLWDEEIYRYGIVYILNDYTLSPVFNIRGINLLKNDTVFEEYSIDDELYFDNNFIIINNENSNNENTKGVFKIDNSDPVFNSTSSIKSIGLKFNFSNDLLVGTDYSKSLKDLTKGFFMVRQKRIPTILTQGVSIGTVKDQGIPVMLANFYNNNSPALWHVGESFLKKDNDKPKLGRSLFELNSDLVKYNGLICPEASVRNSLYGNLFNSSEFVLNKTKYLSRGYFISFEETPKLFGLGDYVYSDEITDPIIANLLLVDKEISSINNGDDTFRSIAGNKHEAWQHIDPVLGDVNELTNDDYTDQDWSESTTKIRGEFNSFIGLNKELEHGQIYNIFIKGYDFDNKWLDYFRIRYNDSSPFSPVGDRVEWSDNINKSFYRGDCYINTYTHRNLHNFADPELPTSDLIIDPWTWYKNYRIKTTNMKIYQDGDNSPIIMDDTAESLTGTSEEIQYKKVLDLFTYKTVDGNGDDTSDITVSKITMPDSKNFDKYSEINGTYGTNKMNRPDVNAVGLGHWLTFKVCSNVNLAFRDIDFSRPDEESIHKKKRSFYPLNKLNLKDNIPDSDVINTGISKTLGDKNYFEIPDVPFIKTNFSNRIYHSEILKESFFKDGSRIFKKINYTDYTNEYGEIIKLVDWYGKLIVVMEHGIIMIPVNERAMVNNASGENVYINTDSVLPKNPRELSNAFGSLWAESVVKTDRYIYGIDTVGKKIWRCTDESFEIISDLKIQKFLNDNIKLNTKDRNKTISEYVIKTSYNAFKKDLMFVFKYNDVSWNLCWNELLEKWTTRYTWFPEFSENINNIFYTFGNINIHTEASNKLYKHGFAGNEDILGDIKPTKWYDEDHQPFEFEFVVIGVQGIQKIFDNLKIISNASEPESFYYEIVGEGYNWSEFKDEIFNFTTNQEYFDYLTNNPDVKKLPYILHNENFTEDRLSGKSRDINIQEHNKTKEKLIESYQKGIDIKKSGILKGNIRYVEDSWDIQIQPITFKYVYIKDGELKFSKTIEMPIRDKYIKIRVRYDGTKYSIINALTTFFTISYA